MLMLSKTVTVYLVWPVKIVITILIFTRKFGRLGKRCIYKKWLASAFSATEIMVLCVKTVLSESIVSFSISQDVSVESFVFSAKLLFSCWQNELNCVCIGVGGGRCTLWIKSVWAMFLSLERKPKTLREVSPSMKLRRLMRVPSRQYQWDTQFYFSNSWE